MYARKDIPTVLPDAVLRCRKLQAAANIELEDMEKTKFRRINSLDWQQQTFQRTLAERHKKWRMYDRAFRLKLKRELGADLAAALRLRTMQDEEEKYILEQKLIEQSFAKQKKTDVKQDDEDEKDKLSSEINANISIERVAKSNSAYPKIQETTNKTTRSAINPRLTRSAASKGSHQTTIVNEKIKLTTQRPRTSRFDAQNGRDSDPTINRNSDFGSVLLRILSNIVATPDLDDDFTIRKRALEARERRLIQTKDDRYFNLVKQLVPQKQPGEKEKVDNDIEEN